MKIGSVVKFNWNKINKNRGNIETLKEWYGENEHRVINIFSPYNSNNKLFEVNGIVGGFSESELIEIN